MRNVIRNILQHFLRFDKRSKEAVVSERQGSECRGMAFIGGDQKAVQNFRRAVYNLSHSGDYVLCSIDTDAREGVQLGCDIEKVQKAEWS